MSSDPAGAAETDDASTYFAMATEIHIKFLEYSQVIGQPICRKHGLLINDLASGILAFSSYFFLIFGARLSRMCVARCDLEKPDTDVFRLGESNLNAFLFADVGAESNGMPLSVVSMLGRLGGDPWATAGRLAGQPRDAAVLELAEIITGTARAERSSAEIMAIATRLASLLPSTGPRSFHHAARPETRWPILDRWNESAVAVLVLAVAAAVLFLRVAGVL